MTLINSSVEQQAAAAWIVADAIMKGRTGYDTAAYDLWRNAAHAGIPLTGKDRLHVRAFAHMVFEAAGSQKSHGLAGYVGEWLWYLLTRGHPPEAGRSVEILSTPSPTVTDSGGDGIVVYRLPGTSAGFVFRLWEMKKFTGGNDDVDPTIRKAWQQLSTKGASYLAAMAWGDKYLAEDTRAFISTLVGQWLDAEPSSGGGVSVVINETAVPNRAFHTSHTHFSTHTHADALQGLIVAIDNFEAFAADVREYVWTAL
ncbi:hypothetical protein ACFZBU_38940 [Embleya sp. NPDC008237]|uniref:hypothetical protein n=1 Tax=Embleya sp. NPDC008237 TaxID=3363978 RepID=UPI0036EE587A